MKSIRWSLIFYFLVLLGVGIVGTAALVYPTTAHALAKKEEATNARLDYQYKERAKELRDKFDKELLSHARTLANVTQVQMDWNRADQESLSRILLGLSSQVRFSIADNLQAAMAVVESFHPAVPEIQVDEQDVFREPHPDVAEYFQINTNSRSVVFHSRSMGDHSFWFDLEKFRQDRSKLGLGWVPENRELEPGHKVRCVTLESRVLPRNFHNIPPAFILPGLRGGPGRNQSYGGVASVGVAISLANRLPPRGSLGGPGNPGPGNPRPIDGQGRPRPGPPGGGFPNLNTIYVQFASETTQLDDELKLLEEERESKKGDSEEESHAILASLRNRIVLISLGAFTAAVVGGYWLVRLGLSPLRRLSKAVGRVSAKDFRLPLEEPSMPIELRPIVATLTGTLDQLKRAFAREKQAAADISHELRTPLAALLTATEVALRKPRKPDEYRAVLEDCRTSGLRMSQMVERLLALARLDAGVDTLRPCEVDVATLAEQCAGTVRPLAEANDVKIRVHHLGNTHLTTDPDKLGEVLCNLLHNAIQYNRRPGSIDVSVIRNNGNLDVEVRDTGIGIAPDKREHIFERFYRVDPSRQADQCNSGLGLAIVKGYVDLMGGTISVESMPGEGSTFRVELPVHPTGEQG